MDAMGSVLVLAVVLVVAKEPTVFPSCLFTFRVADRTKTMSSNRPGGSHPPRSRSPDYQGKRNGRHRYHSYLFCTASGRIVGSTHRYWSRYSSRWKIRKQKAARLCRERCEKDLTNEFGLRKVVKLNGVRIKTTYLMVSTFSGVVIPLTWLRVFFIIWLSESK
jgi:hypothetical protein